MALSNDKHVLIRLRKHLQLTQKELARLCRYSEHTIQSVEIGRLMLSRGLAGRIAKLTGAPIEWLLANDSASPFPKLRLGESGIESSWIGPWAAQALWVDFDERIWRILDTLADKQSLALFEHYGFKFLKELEAAFGPIEREELTYAEIHKRLMERLGRFDPGNEAPSEYRAKPTRPRRKAPHQNRASAPTLFA
jgi:transcriptional regulator with XRE-family HTH domain